MNSHPSSVEPSDTVPVDPPTDGPLTRTRANGRPSTAEALVPLRFGRYETLNIIGHGGMGVVWRVRDRDLNRIVALKTLLSGAETPPEIASRFLIEANAAAKLNHRHIVPVYDFQQHDGQAYFVMPFLPNGSLIQHRELYRCPRAAARLMEKVARAIQHAHTNGVLHRDLKPGNILIDAEGEPCVADFGLAKLADLKMDLTLTNAPLGTGPYMSPEAAAGDSALVGRASDIWSLGVTLYELILDCRPFTAATMDKLTPQILRDDPPRPTEQLPDFDVQLEAVILKCLQKRIADRYDTAGELADDLGRWLAGEPVLAKYDPRRTLAARRLRQRRQFLFGGAALGLTVSLGGLGWWYDISQTQREENKTQVRRAAALAQIMDEFQFGNGPVNLLDDASQPRWLNPLLGAPTKSRDSLFALEGRLTGLVDLLPSPGRLEYRYRGEVRIDAGPGSAGLYVGRSEGNSADGAVHGACFLGLKKKADRYQPAFQCKFFPIDAQTAAIGGLIHAANLPAKPIGAWWELELRVTADSIIALVDGAEFSRQKWSELLKRATSLLKGRLTGLRPDFSPLNGLGVAAEDARCSFRNLTVVRG